MMQIRDHLLKYRKRTVLSSTVILFLLTIFLIYNYIAEMDIIFKSIFNGVYIFLIGFCIILIGFEFIRPDFVVNDEYVIFTNYPIWTLLQRERYQIKIEINQIASIDIMPNGILFNTKNSDKTLTIREHQFENYKYVSNIIIQILNKNEIPVHWFIKPNISNLK